MGEERRGRGVGGGVRVSEAETETQPNMNAQKKTDRPTEKGRAKERMKTDGQRQTESDGRWKE